jgi:hypothetical protein
MYTVRLVRRQAQAQLVTVLAAAGSLAAISVIFGSPIVSAVLVIEAAGLGGATLPLILIPGLVSAGVGSLIFIVTTGAGFWLSSRIRGSGRRAARRVGPGSGWVPVVPRAFQFWWRHPATACRFAPGERGAPSSGQSPALLVSPAYGYLQYGYLHAQLTLTNPSHSRPTGLLPEHATAPRRTRGPTEG